MQEISHILEVVGAIVVALVALARVLTRKPTKRKQKGRVRKTRTKAPGGTPARTTNKKAGVKKPKCRADK